MITKEQLEQNGYEIINGKLYKKAFTDAKGRKRKRKRISLCNYTNGSGFVCKGYRVQNGSKATTLTEKQLDSLVGNGDFALRRWGNRSTELSTTTEL
jgi:hypothetical protein